MDNQHRQFLETELARVRRQRRALSQAEAIPTGQNKSLMDDVGTSLKRGFQQVPGQLAGLADIPVAAITGQPYVSQAADVLGKATGFQPGKWAQEAEAEYSPEHRTLREGARAQEGYLDTAGYYLSHPSLIAGGVAESLPGMLVGGALGRGVQLASKAITPVAGAAIGEGAIMAGGAMENMLGEGADPRTAAMLATGVGVGGGLISGYVGGTIAQKMGIIDPDVLIAGGARSVIEPPAAGAGFLARNIAKGSLLARMGGGAIAEGVFEEAPQSALETMMGNVAVNRDPLAGVPESMAVGTILGGAMGAATNIVPPARPQVAPQDKTQEQPPPPAAQEQPPLLPAPSGAVAEQPAVVAEQPAVVAEQPAVVAEQPAAPYIANLKNPVGVPKTVWEGVKDKLAAAKSDDEVVAILIAAGVSDSGQKQVMNRVKAERGSETRVPPAPAAAPAAAPVKLPPKPVKMTQPLLDSIRQKGNKDLDTDFTPEEIAAIYDNSGPTSDDFAMMGTGTRPIAARAKTTLAAAKDRVSVPLSGPMLNALRRVINGYAEPNTRKDNKVDERYTKAIKDMAEANPRFARIVNTMNRIIGLNKYIESLASDASSTTSDLIVFDQSKKPIREAYAHTKTELAQQRADQEAKRTQPFTAVAQDDAENLANHMRMQYSTLASYYATLEKQVGELTGQDAVEGRKHLRAVQYLSKLYAHNVSDKQAAGRDMRQVDGASELPPGVKFSMTYGAYTRADGDKRVFGQETPEMGFKREENVLAERQAGAEDKLEESKLYKHAHKKVTHSVAGVDTHANSKQLEGSKRLGYNLLVHIRDTGNWYSRLLASRLIYVLRDTLPNVRLLPATTEKNQLAHYSPETHTVTLYADTYSNVAVLHEFLHAASVAYVRNNKNSPEVKRLSKLLKTMLAPINKEIAAEGADAVKARLRKEYDSRTAAILGMLRDDHKGLYEFITYAFTEKGIQNYMKAQKYKVGPTSGLQHFWGKFVEFIKTMLGIKGTDNMLAEFMDAGTVILQESATKSAAGKVENLGEMDTKNETGMPGILDIAATPADNTAEEQATADELRRGEEKQEATEAARKAAEKAKKKAADQAARAEAAQEAHAVGDALREEREQTLVTPADKVVLGRWGETWTKAAQEWLDSKGMALAKWANQNDTLPRSAMLWVAKNFVEHYGLPSFLRGTLHHYGAERHVATGQALAGWEAMQNMEYAEQNQFIEYLQTNDEKKLDGINAERIKNLKTFAQNLHAEFNKAREYGIIPKEHLNKTLVDFITWQSTVTSPLATSSKIGSLIPPKANDKFKTYQINGSNVVDEDGPVTDAKGEYYKGYHRNTGEPMFVKVGTSKEALVKQRIVLDNTEPVWALKRALPENEFLLHRLFTTKEHLASRKVDTFATSLALTLQDWSRRIEGTHLLRALDKHNGLGGTDPYISKTIPMKDNGDPVPVLDVTDLKQHGKYKELKKARIPGFWVKLPDDPEQWGDLAGQYIHGPVYQTLLDYADNAPIIDIKALRQANMIWKKMKTVYSPVTHVNNIMGNVVLSYYHDIPFRNIKRAYAAVLAGAEPGLIEELDEAGALIGTIKQELDPESKEQFIKAISESKVSDNLRGLTNGFIDLSKAIAGLDKADAWMSELYANEDNIFRLALYITELENSQTRGDDVPISEQKRRAGKAAADAFVNYNIYAPGVKVLRETFLPFLAWPYRMSIIMSKIAITKPWKIANTMAAIYVLDALAYSLSGDDEDEEKRKKDNMPEYMKHGVWGIPGLPTYVRVPFFGDDENFATFGIGRMIPMGDLANIGDSGIPGMISPSGPVVSILNVLGNRDPFTGQDIRKDTNTPTENLKASLGELAKQLGPAVATQTNDWWDKAVLDKRGPLGVEASGWLEFAQIFGLNMRQMNTTENQYSNMQRIQGIKRDFGMAINKHIRNESRYGTIDYDELSADVMDMRKRMYEAMYDAQGGDDAVE